MFVSGANSQKLSTQRRPPLPTMCYGLYNPVGQKKGFSGNWPPGGRTVWAHALAVNSSLMAPLAGQFLKGLRVPSETPPPESKVTTTGLRPVRQPRCRGGCAVLPSVKPTQVFGPHSDNNVVGEFSMAKTV